MYFLHMLVNVMCAVYFRHFEVLIDISPSASETVRVSCHPVIASSPGIRQKNIHCFSSSISVYFKVRLGEDLSEPNCVTVSL